MNNRASQRELMLILPLKDEHHPYNYNQLHHQLKVIMGALMTSLIVTVIVMSFETNHQHQKKQIVLNC